MTVTAEMVATVRRLVNESGTDTYSDTDIENIIKKYPMMDELGKEPYYWTTTSTVPTKTWNTDWIPTYNLNYAAADIWDEKAAVLAGLFDFSADGGTYTRSQGYNQAVSMSKFYRGRGSIKTITLIKKPDEPASLSSYPAWIGNLPEE